MCRSTSLLEGSTRKATQVGRRNVNFSVTQMSIAQARCSSGRAIEGCEWAISLCFVTKTIQQRCTGGALLFYTEL